MGVRALAGSAVSGPTLLVYWPSIERTDAAMIRDQSTRISGYLSRLVIVIVCGAANGIALASELATDRCNSATASSMTVTGTSSPPCAESNAGRLPQLAPAQSLPAPSASLLPADRLVTWNPGL